MPPLYLSLFLSLSLQSQDYVFFVAKATLELAGHCQSVSLSHFSISSLWRHTKDWDYIMCLSTKIPEKPIFRNYWTFWFCFQTWHLFFLLSLCGVWGDKWWSHCGEIVSIVAVVSSAVIRLKCPHTDCTSLLHFTYFPLSSHSTRWKE